MYIRNEDTICAPATVPGTGAISVIRVSGPEALTIADKVITCRKGSIAEAGGYTLKFGFIYDSANNCSSEDFETSPKVENCSKNGANGQVIDEVLVSIFRAPHSYTGENSVEISCHASSYIVSSILNLLYAAGARAAEPGEFTQRAYLNGKMDLAQAEAVADVIASQNAAAHRIAFKQMKGGFSSELKGMRNELLELVSLMELELDFSEEEVEFADRSQLDNLLDQIIAHVSRLIDSFRLGNAIKNGVPVAIAGATNTGKSTLLNSILGMKLAITSNVSGTTRNIINGIYNDDDSQIIFVDTPGVHKPKNKLGNIMNRKAYNNTEGVDVILFLVDISKGFGKGDQFILDRIKDKGVPIFLLLNKIDQVKNKEKLLSEINKLKELYDFAEIIPISAMKKDNVDTLVSCIKKYLDDSDAIFSEDDLGVLL